MLTNIGCSNQFIKTYLNFYELPKLALGEVKLNKLRMPSLRRYFSCMTRGRVYVPLPIIFI